MDFWVILGLTKWKVKMKVMKVMEGQGIGQAHFHTTWYNFTVLTLPKLMLRVSHAKRISTPY